MTNARLTGARALPFVLAVLALSACSEDFTSSTPFESEEPFAFTVDAAGVTTLDVNGINGTITVTGSATADSVTITGTKRVNADTQEKADDGLNLIDVVVATPTGRVVVTSDHPDSESDRNFQVDYDITIPDDVVVIVDNANGTISINRVEARVDVDNANGDVSFDDVTGNVTVDLGNGGVGGDITLPSGGAIDITIGNGTIDLEIPQNTSAQFSASVGNGTISVLVLDLQDEVRTDTSVTGTFGAGDGQIQLSIGNGTIVVVGF
jgi:hypothetical protein